MAVKIVTDSGSDLPSEIVKDLDIAVLPLIVYSDEQEFKDGVDISSVEVMQQMREGKIFKTAQVAPISFIEQFNKYAQNGDSCIYIGFSSQLSATYKSSTMAFNEVKETYPNFDGELIDTKCASLGQGLIVYQAALMAKEGKSKEEIVDTVHTLLNSIQHIFTVDDLEYLFRGGRVSKTAAFVGGILNIKPVLHVDDGKLIPLEKARGRKKAVKRLQEIMVERGVNLDNPLIGITHGDDLQAAENLRDAIKEKYENSSFIINNIGCAIGAHSGPGTLALFFYS